MTSSIAELTKTLSSWPLDREQKGFLEQATKSIDESNARKILDLLREAESAIVDCTDFLGNYTNEEADEAAEKAWKSETPVELNTEIRDMVRTYVEQSVAKAWTAFGGILHATNEALVQWQSEVYVTSKEASEIAYKSSMSYAEQSMATTFQFAHKLIRSMSYAEQNTVTTFQFAQKLMEAKNATEVLRLQSEYLTRQMEVLSAQAQEIGRSASEQGQSGKLAGGMERLSSQARELGQSAGEVRKALSRTA